jgi:glutamyl-tRNA synthetase
MYDALGWEKPLYAHAPLILNPSGKGKLSKRAQAFTDAGQQVLVQVREFRQAGYLPEAITNFLCNVGWAFGDDREVFGLEEASARFALETVNPAPARLPYSKLEWLNGVYIREMSSEELAAAVQPFLQEAGLEADDETTQRAMPLVRERLKTLADAEEWLGFFFRDALDYPPADLIGKKMDAAASLTAIQQVRETLADLEPFEEETLDATLRALASELGLKVGQLLGVLRVAVTGQKVAPPLFGTLAVLGRDKCLARIDIALERLAALAG